VKPGSEESTFAFVKSMLSGSTGSNDVEGNSFSAIAIRANTVAVTMDANSTLTATGNFCSALSLGGLYAGEEMVANATVTIAGTIEGDIVSATTLGSNTIKVKAEYADDLLAEGYCAGEAENGLVVIMGKTLAQIGDTYYATVEAALAAAQVGTKVTVMSREAAVAFGETLVATGGKEGDKKGVDAFDVATLLGGSFVKKDGKLVYDYAFGVSNVAYVDGAFKVTVAIEDADSKVADSTVTRELKGRKLVLRMVVEGETADEITIPNPVFKAVDGQVTCDVPVTLPADGVGKATYFTVKVID
jgi:cytoskeletal protein CcmA (bactofilin family)